MTLLGEIEEFNGNVIAGEQPREQRTDFPVVTVDVLSNDTKKELETGERSARLCTLVLKISATVYIDDATLQVVGDGTQIGVLDAEKLIKEKLYSKFPALNGTCRRFVLSTEDVDNTNYPARTVVLTGAFDYVEVY